MLAAGNLGHNPAVRFHDIANFNPLTRLTEGDAGSYADRLRVFLTDLLGPPLDATSGAFHAIAAETESLLIATSFETIRAAWQDVSADLHAPLEDFLLAFFKRRASLEPTHFFQQILDFNNYLSHHADRGRTGALIGFVSGVIGKAVAETLQDTRDEHYVRDSEPIRILEVAT